MSYIRPSEETITADISTAFLQRSLTLRHLRLIVAVEELRQVGRVAEALHVTQPAVSKALAEIENGVGVALFDRTPRGMVPTAHGSCLLRYAHSMINEITRAADELKAIDQDNAATLSVGASAGAGTGSLLSEALVRARQRLPDLAVAVSEGTREHLLRQLRTGKLDLVVGAAGDNAVPADLDCMPLYIDAPVIVCGTRHPLAARRPGWSELVAESWVVPPPNTRVRAALEALFRRVGSARPRVLAETLSLELILELLAGGAALAVLPQQLGRRLALAGQVRRLDVATPGMVMPVSVYAPAAAPASTAVDTFKQCLVEVAAQR